MSAEEETNTSPEKSPTEKKVEKEVPKFSAESLVTKELLQLAKDIHTIVPTGTWESQGSEEEILYENASKVTVRPPIKMSFEVKRNIIVNHHSALLGYVTKEASEDSRDLRGTHNPLYEILRDEVEVGVQAVPRKTDSTTQTYFARRVNAAVQAEPTVVDACISHIDVPKKESAPLSSFLKAALPRTLHSLTQNEEISIYTDDYNAFKEDERLIGAHDNLVLLEKGNYTHAITKDRLITSISWRSARTKDDCICVTSTARTTLEERIEKARRCEGSMAMVWELSDPMHPRCILEAPDEVQVLRFCPSRPNIVAGGSMNGQVFLWDLSDAAKVAGYQGNQPQVTPEAVLTGEFKEAGEVLPMAEHVKGVTLENDGDVVVPRLQPFQLSRVELSHQRPVHDLQWFPSNVECTFDGKQTVVEESHQFITVSDDGSMMVWDTRPEYLPQEKLRKIRHQSKTGGQAVPWVPLNKYLLTNKDGTANLMAFRVFLDGLMADKETPSYVMAVGTTNGELCTCSLATRGTSSLGGIVAALGTTSDNRCVRQVLEAHSGPVYSVERHPTIGDVFLTCGDHTFKVWRDGLELPLYTSPFLDSSVTCAGWSPGRPAVVFVGTEDGKVEVWDLLDRNAEPLLVHHLVQDAITTLSFKPMPPVLPANYSQQVGIGTALGSFHWYLLPTALSKAPSTEKRNFRAMLEREVRRVLYYTWRWGERQVEFERYGNCGPKMLDAIAPKAIGGAANAKADDEEDADVEAHYEHDMERDEEFLALVDKLHKIEEEKLRSEAIM
ncbi:WDdomain 63 [Angomonas deanei]|nr:WDdomain 63 [Angomonas deanei]|eukprot:EPY41665.1 WDdomain 63 [Angomonas deanei]